MAENKTKETRESSRERSRKKDQMVRDLVKQVDDLNKQVKLLEEQNQESQFSKRKYTQVEVFTDKVTFRKTIRFPKLPTTDTDLLVGELWNDSGTIKIKQ